jgi:hypothetical protein
MSDVQTTAPEQGLAPQPKILGISRSAGLWLGIGIFLFVSFFIPVYIQKIPNYSGMYNYDRGNYEYDEYGNRRYTPPQRVEPIYTTKVVFFWDFFSAPGGTSTALFAIFMAAAGVALPIVVFTAKGLGRGIAVLSIGGVMAIFLIVASASGGAFAGTGSGGTSLIFFMMGMLAIASALVGNNIRMHFDNSFLSRLLGGISAAVFCFCFIMWLILGITSTMFRGETMAIIVSVFMLLCEMAFVAASILIMVNFGRNAQEKLLAKSAQLLSLISFLVMAGVMILLPTIGIATIGGEGAGLGALMMFLLLLRFIGYLYSILLMLGGGLADLLENAVYSKPAMP